MKFINKLLPIVLTLILAMHFTLVLLFVAPINPISNKTSYFVSNYINPIFTQTWTLFAPDPIDRNTSLQIRTISVNGSKGEWIDSSNIIVEKMHKNYFSPYNRIARIPESILNESFSEEYMFTKLREKFEENKNNKEIEKLNKVNKEKFKKSLPLLQRYASSFIKATHNEKEVNEIKFIEMRVIQQEAKPFSQRDKVKQSEWRLIHEFEKVNFDKKIPSLI
ncbi:DUF5819 family protein [Staphylococcus chromogenes]|uniref:DUF5819 family protein n=1 Tax=Staphylococcus chromogenes TaxID=46126 RepID=UPI0028844798|nr:DUF5819 family protein [Staphylococcus chromogenes]MDT0700367.1 DUF5819 family protein [Staphylococcus chromogenes]